MSTGPRDSRTLRSEPGAFSDDKRVSPVRHPASVMLSEAPDGRCPKAGTSSTSLPHACWAPKIEIPGRTSVECNGRAHGTRSKQGSSGAERHDAEPSPGKARPAAGRVAAAPADGPTPPSPCPTSTSGRTRAETNRADPRSPSAIGEVVPDRARRRPRRRPPCQLRLSATIVLRSHTIMLLSSPQHRWLNLRPAVCALEAGAGDRVPETRTPARRTRES